MLLMMVLGCDDVVCGDGDNLVRLTTTTATNDDEEWYNNDEKRTKQKHTEVDVNST